MPTMTWREKITKTLTKEQERLEEKLRYAESSYRDNGYTRYWNMMEKTQADLDEIADYMNGPKRIASQEAERMKYAKAIRTFRKAAKEYAAVNKDYERPVDKTVQDLLRMLDLEMYDEGIY